MDIPPYRSAAFLKSCLRRAGHKDATFRILPNASHILTAYKGDGCFAAGFPEVLTNWMSQRFKKRPDSPIGRADPSADRNKILANRQEG